MTSTSTRSDPSTTRATECGVSTTTIHSSVVAAPRAMRAVEDADAARRRVSRIASHVNASSSRAATTTESSLANRDADDDDAHDALDHDGVVARGDATALTAWLARHPPGTSLDVSSSIPIFVDQARIDAFASCTNDNQWIHGADAPGGAVAHGFLTLSLLTTLTSRVIANDWAQKHINYGLNRVRFIAPVRVNDVVFLKRCALERVSPLPARAPGARCEYLATLAVRRQRAATSTSTSSDDIVVIDVCVASWITTQYLRASVDVDVAVAQE